MAVDVTQIEDESGEWVIGEGFRVRIEERGLTALGPEIYFAPGYSFMLTDQGPLWYSQYTNQVLGPTFE